MDGREASMVMPSGSSQYFLHKSGVSSAETSVSNTPIGFRALAPHDAHGQSNVRSNFSGIPFPADASLGNFTAHGSSMAGVPSSEPVKKKRGRPRKYGPNGKVPLGLLPKSLSTCPDPSPGSDPMSPKRSQGRPPGTGRKQRLAAMGGWMNNSAGQAFSPHVITVRAGEDVAAKVLSFSQQRPRAISILAGGGTVSAVTLRQPASVSDTITFEGRFEILCLSGSYLVAEDGGPRDRIGGVSVSLSSPDGNVIGGSVGMLIAASLVQVVVCSFIFGDPKIIAKNKQVDLGSPRVEKDSKPRNFEKSASKSNHSHHMYTPSATNVWPASRAIDMNNILHPNVDLTHG
ncbi:hypothetical protein MLD38_039132 [Melastoma candidum]|uniref:Uncharacterized protein n=1 Tax=Melastoma candidum TaxID=119954 RepID=A0ACB9L2M8_9MYRT|nr:hypothetical protein MLD38_039132 [Melastoma candidum]